MGSADNDHSVCDHDLARFDNGMVACTECFHVLGDDEFGEWLDGTRRLGAALAVARGHGRT